MSKRRAYDGRTRIAKAMKRLEAEFLESYGGADPGPAARVLCRQAATVAAELEAMAAASLRCAPIDAALRARRTNSLMRLLDKLQANRAAPPDGETLSEYAQRKRADAEREARA